jgi:LCP family protein required for cell wall assembly
VLLASSALSFLRRFAIAMLAVAVLAAAGFVSAKAYGKREFGKSRTIQIPEGVLAKVKPGEPANYLLIGSDVRPADETPAEAKAYGSNSDVGGQGRSDVMMVLHIDPVAHTGMLVSFPRDLVVEIPGHGRNLLNSAYAFGGPALVIETLQAAFTPMRINHYLEVDFRSFKSIVNAIGHIHIWFPTPVHDPYTGLDVPNMGCQSLDGDQALAYARSRHYYIPRDQQNVLPWNPVARHNSQGQVTSITSVGWFEDPRADLDRIPRQQYFLRTVSQAATDKTGRNPLKIQPLLNAVFKNLAHDQNLKYDDLAALALTFRGFSPAKVEMSTLPIVPSPFKQFPGQVAAKFPDAIAVISRLSNFTPPPKQPIVKPLVADKVKVRVVNGSGVKNAGGAALEALVAAGFRSAGPAADADRSDYQTQVRYAPGKFHEGYTVAVAVGTPNLVEAASAKNTLGGDVLLIVGRDYDKLKHRFDLVPRPSGLASSTSTTSTTVRRPVSTTTTTVRPLVDTHFVPVDPTTGAALVGCPLK